MIRLIIALLLIAPAAHAARCENPPDVDHTQHVLGGPFYDCGPKAGVKSPSPTKFPHASNDLTGWAHCIEEFNEQGWQFPDMRNGAIHWYSSDMDIYNENRWPDGVDIVFHESFVRWTDMGAGRIGLGGQFICDGAIEVEVNGQCVCPVPEPSPATGLMIGALALLALFPNPMLSRKS